MLMRRIREPRLGRDLALARAAQPGQALHAVGIGDDEVDLAEFADLAVEGRHLFVRQRAANDQTAFGKPVEVVEVERLTRFEHHEVRDVDEVVDRALGGEREAEAHPERRGSHDDLRKALRDEAPAV